MTGSAISAVARPGFVTERLGITVRVTPAAAGAERFAHALELGLRRNPKRAQLLVSKVLGKHIPAAAGEVLEAAAVLAAAVREHCDGQLPVVVGFAETATGLGHGVAASSGPGGEPAPYLHTTRRPAPADAYVVRFTEDHSHATDQALVLTSDDALRDGRPLVLVDDELSTGNTAVNAIRQIQARWPRDRYVLASLADCRDVARREEVQAAVKALGAEVVSVALLDGEVTLPHGVLRHALAFMEAMSAAGSGPAVAAQPRARAAPVPVTWTNLALPDGVPALGAHGWDPAQELAARAAVAEAATALPVPADARTLVLGDEELMYFPQLLASELNPQVRTSTTTRTPAFVIDRPGYPLRTALRFPSTEDGTRPAYAYNVAPSAGSGPFGDDQPNAPGFEHIVAVTEAPRGPRTDGLVAALAASATVAVHVLRLVPAAHEDCRGNH